MSEKRQGFVSLVHKNEKKPEKSGKYWFAYGFKLTDAEGNEDKTWYNFGFNKEIPFKKDDYVSFDAERKDASSMNLVEGSGKIHKNPPQRKSTGNSSAGSAKATKSELFGDIGGYNTEDDIRRMAYANARTAALQAVTILLENDALSVPKASGKASQAKRFDVITAAIDKLTVEYFYDGANGRKLESIADAGEVDNSPDMELPDKEEESPVVDDSPDVCPPDDDDDDDERSF